MKCVEELLEQDITEEQLLKSVSITDHDKGRVLCGCVYSICDKGSAHNTYVPYTEPCCIFDVYLRPGFSNSLVQQAEILSVSQYGDVVEERNIEGLCGYPLCNASLGPTPKQKCHISVAKKQILDLTERKVRP